MPVLILDYDGTLHDSSAVYEPAFRKVMRELETLGWIPEKEYSSAEILAWVGYSPAEMWQRFHPELSEEQRGKAGKRIGQYMLKDIAAGRGRLYPGAQDALEELRTAGYTLVFFSNCDRAYADTHRRAFGLDRWISEYYCVADYGDFQKEDIFRAHIQRPGTRYITVGDRNKDIRLAKACGLPSIGCLYGFGSPEELREADLLVRDVRELRGAADKLT